MENPQDSPMITVLLIDDHKLFRSGIRSLLQRHTEFVVLDDAADGVEGVKKARLLNPDVILLDLNMPGVSGLETLQMILQDRTDAAVIMLTVSEDAEDLTATLQAGALGYLVKNIETDVLVKAMRRAARGESVIADTMTAKLVAQMRDGLGSQKSNNTELDKLTPREKETLACLARGESNKLIARSLNVSENTVKIYVQNILKKLHLSGRVQAAIFAIEHGMDSQ